MLRVPLNNIQAKRTLAPEYNGLPWATKLHPEWDKSKDIVPGTVMARITKEFVAPIGATFGSVTNTSKQEPFGLSALFCAPKFGIDENRGTNEFAVWVGDQSDVFKVYAPAFDMEATWTDPVDGSRVPLYANASGLLTPTKGTGFSAIPVATLISADMTGGFIRISLDSDYPA